MTIRLNKLRPTTLASCLATSLSLGFCAPGAVMKADAATPRPALEALISSTWGPNEHGRHSLSPAASDAKRGSPRPAMTIVPINCNDSGFGSLRQAMTAALDNDTIDLNSLHCSLITLTTGALVTGANNLHVIGPGAGALDISGDQASSVIYHFGTGTIGISGVTIADGDYTRPTSPNGGCIYSSGNVAIYNSIVRDCAISVSSNHAAQGGGIYAKGNLTLASSSVTGNLVHNSIGKAVGGGFFAKGHIAVAYSTISDNTASAPETSGARSVAGGFFNNGNALIAGSTISGNQAGVAGGIALSGFLATQTMTIEESTISGNHATGGIGGIETGQAAVKILNSTIAFNSESTAAGAGLYVYDTVQLESTIIAGNTSNSMPADVGGNGVATLSGHNNLIMHSTITPLPDNTLSADPMLAPLFDNGGVTRTHALLAASPAIDHGNNSSAFGVDQRGPGFARVVGSAADIGAFERNSDIIFANGFN